LNKRIKIEQLLLLAVLIGFLFPLSTTVSILKIVTWNVPGAVLLFWIILRGVNRRRFRIKTFDLWDYSIVGIILLYFVMTMLGVDPLSNLPFLINYLYCFILAIYFRRSYGSIFTSRTLIIFAFLTVGLESSVGLIQQITSSEFGNLSVYIGDTPETSDLRSIGETDMGRVHGTLGTGNLVGSWMNMFMPFIIFGSVYIKNKRLWLWRNLMLILSVIAILLTISRFNIALFTGSLLFTYMLYVKNKFSTKIRLSIKSASLIFVSILVLIMLTLTVTFWQQIGMMGEAIEFRFSDTFEEIETAGVKTSGLAARMEMNKGALEAFIRSPLIGLGYRNSRWIWPTVEADVPEGWKFQPHNLYMIMLTEGGIFLFISYFIFTLLPFYRIWRCRKTQDPFLIAFFLALSTSIGIQMIYITFTSANFAAVYMMIQGCAMGYTDNLLKESEESNEV